VESAIPNIRRDRKHDQIIRFIALGIMRGEITDEQSWMSSELELCRHLNVSRTVLRESVKVLASKGLVDVRPKVGIRIRPRSDWNLFDPDLLAWQQEEGVDDLFLDKLCEVRLIVEPAAAELAAVRATAEEIATLFEFYRQMEVGVKNRDAYIVADIKFHSAIVSASHNDLLMQLNSTIRTAFRRAQDLVSPDPDGPTRSLTRHKKVANAIRKHNGREARSAMERLVKLGTQDFYQQLHSDNPEK